MGEVMTDSLDYAIKIIEAYQHDIRQRGLDREGFCQGVIYLNALSQIERLRAGEADAASDSMKKLRFRWLVVVFAWLVVVAAQWGMLPPW